MVVMSDQIWEIPRSFINSFALMFLVNFRPDICFTVSMVGSYLVEPHWIGAKNLLRYLRGTISHGLRYTARNMKLHDYSMMTGQAVWRNTRALLSAGSLWILLRYHG